MNAQHIHSHDEQKSQSERLLRAKLNLVVDALPGTIWINPSWALVAVLPLGGLFPVVGTVPLSHIAFVLSLQILNSIIGVVMLRQYRKNPGSAQAWLIRLSLFSGLVGISWGLLTWTLWLDENAANNVLLFANVAVVLWSYAMSRAMHMSVYLAAIIPAVLISAVRIAISPSLVSSALLYMLVISFVYTFILARALHGRVNQLVRTGAANEDLNNDLRHAHDDALRKRFEAEAANASKTTFLANMSHELRTPLNAILGFSELIAHETLGPVGTPRYRDYAGDIHASGSHLLAIINDILDIAKIESGKMSIEPRAMDPRLALDKAVAVVMGRAREKKQIVAVHLSDGHKTIVADERALKQIVINLMANAVKFTPDNGEITISGEHTADGGFLLCVKDNGPGISQAMLERIFTPFNQLDNRYNRQEGGTGLGLSLVRGLAELHGGRAWIESELGAGVRAYVYLPAGHLAEMVTQNELRASA